MSATRVYLIGGPANGKILRIPGDRPPPTIYIAVPQTPTHLPDDSPLDPLDSTIKQAMYQVRPIALFGHRVLIGVPDTPMSDAAIIRALFPADLADLILESPVLR